MTLDEQIRRFDNLLDFLDNELPVLAEQVLATDLVALITNRVVQRGETYLGGKFKPYSRRTVAAYRFWGKSRNQAAEKKVRALARARAGITYADFRSLNNLETSVKNFEFTGEMWRLFGIRAVQRSSRTTRIQIGGTTAASQKKIDENSSREGISIIEPSQSEVNIVASTAQAWFDREASRILNA